SGRRTCTVRSPVISSVLSASSPRALRHRSGLANSAPLELRPALLPEGPLPFAVVLAVEGPIDQRLDLSLALPLLATGDRVQDLLRAADGQRGARQELARQSPGPLQCGDLVETIDQAEGAAGFRRE